MRVEFFKGFIKWGINFWGECGCSLKEREVNLYGEFLVCL